MAGENPSTKRPAASGASRRAPASARAGGLSRTAFRLVCIPILAVAGVLIYRGVHERFTLPECNSARAKNTLAGVFKELKIEPLSFEQVKTISISKAEIVCNALLPLADGASVNIDYRFFWQGATANMKYSVSRREPRSSAIDPLGARARAIA